jgi:hypothetical protein
MVGGGSVGMTNNGLPLPQTWRLKFVCHGTGKIQLSVDPKVGVAGYTAPCDGKVQFDRFTNATNQPYTLKSINVTTDPDNDWQVLIEGCKQSVCL